jgi:hypothetical protein
MSFWAEYKSDTRDVVFYDKTRCSGEIAMISP